MSPTLGCKGTAKRCRPFTSDDLGEAIEHLRRDHEPYHIKRPPAVGVSDSHGHVWYCYACEGKLGQDHMSYDSDRAMWDHLKQCHDQWLVDFLSGDEAFDYWYDFEERTGVPL